MTDTLQDKRNVPIFIHSTIDDMTDVSPNAMRVYMHLARRSSKTGAAWPSYQKIGDHCFKTIYKHPDTRKLHAIRAVEELVAAGLLEKTPRYHNGMAISNLYALVDPAVTVESQRGDATVTAAVIVESLPVVTVASQEDTPIEDTPIEDTPIETAAQPDDLPKAKGGKPKAEPGNPPHPNTTPIMDAYVEALGYKPKKYGKEAATAKQLAIEGYEPKDIVAAYEYYKADKFWIGKHLSLSYIHDNIAALQQGLLNGKPSMRNQLGGKNENNGSNNSLTPEEVERIRADRLARKAAANASP